MHASQGLISKLQWDGDHGSYLLGFFLIKRIINPIWVGPYIISLIGLSGPAYKTHDAFVQWV